MVKQESANGNPVAKLIVDMDLGNNQVTLQLRDWNVDDSDEEEREEGGSDSDDDSDTDDEADEQQDEGDAANLFEETEEDPKPGKKGKAPQGLRVKKPKSKGARRLQKK